MSLRVLVLAWMLLAGCAGPQRAHEVVAPTVVSAQVWQQIDVDLIQASEQATVQADGWARTTMEYWRTRIYQQTDEKFIPWFDGYWTQEWLSIKVGWYRLSDQGEQDPSAKRLASYLQEQYRARVLAPVALEIDPDSIMDQAAQFYLEQMGKQLAVITQRYGVPTDQLDRHINQIPAISLAPPADHSVSLYQALHAAPLTQLPAYRALSARIHLAGGANDGTSSAGINSVAQQTSEKLQSEFTGRGVAGAVATAVGRVAGAMISLGVAGFRAIVHEHEQPDTQVRIRKSLGEAFDKAWLKLVSDPSGGVTATTHYLSAQIEGYLAAAVEQRVLAEPPVTGTTHP
ncbi:hypothetical protein HX870_28175 [Pseudomonas gingeri]|uniref:hypothetical protein n=1 Tax=Pseudomonas gingeri TaxID=117681 RepID=UPI0015A430D3|nr:hypothetical protein [Pseudomonas gingeri]NWD71485.1 hypothetical protein [Pseudomonas gingeri]